MTETMVGLAVFAVLMTGIYSVLTTGLETYVESSAKADIQQTARLAMQAMASDLRMAGYGYFTDSRLPPQEPKITIANSTQITFYADLNSLSQVLTTAANAGDTQFVVQTANAYNPGNTVYFINGGTHEWQTVTNTSPPHVVNLVGALANPYPVGALVGRPLPVTYCWNSTVQNCPTAAPNPDQPNTIYRDDGDGSGYVALVSNVTAFFLSYFDTNDAAMTFPISPSDLFNIRRIRVNFTVQTPRANGPSGTQNYRLLADVRPRNL
jgi:type II secretory pathway pseudopilin PulG